MIAFLICFPKPLAKGWSALSAACLPVGRAGRLWRKLSYSPILFFLKNNISLFAFQERFYVL
jgi:hypothetical protein